MSNEVLETVCHFCYWAEWDGDTQTGCKLGRLKEFGEDAKFDEQSKSYRVDRFCNACRPLEWGEDTLDAKARLDDEIAVRHCIVLHYDEHNLDLLDQFVDRLDQWDLPPQEIRLIVAADLEVSLDALYDRINPKLKNTEIYIHLAVEDKLKSVDYSIKRSKSQFFSTHELTDKIPEDFLLKVNTCLNEKMLRFNLIKANDTYPTVYCKALHIMVGGNKFQPVEEKLTLLEEQHDGRTIYTWDEICQILS